MLVLPTSPVKAATFDGPDPSVDVDLFANRQRHADFRTARDKLIATYRTEGCRVGIDTFARLVANCRAQPPADEGSGAVSVGGMAIQAILLLLRMPSKTVRKAWSMMSPRGYRRVAKASVVDVLLNGPSTVTSTQQPMLPAGARIVW